VNESAGLQLQPNATRYTIACFLDDIVERHGDRVAICGEDLALSYRELRTRAHAFAKGLVAAGVVKGSRVAILLGSRPEWAVAYFGASLLGAVVVPVNTFAKPEELDHILRHSDASVAVLQTEVAGNRFVDDLLERHPRLGQGQNGRLECPALPHLRQLFSFDAAGADRAGITSFGELVANGQSVDDALIDAMANEIDPGDDALIVYTSGTTALPKGVVHMQRAPVIQAWRFAEHMGLTPDDVVYSSYPFFWTAGIAMALGGSLASGARLVIDEVFHPARALERIEREGATAVQAWPHQEKALAEHPTAKGRDLSRVHKIEFARALSKMVGLEKDVWGTHGSYGMSETFTICSSVPATTSAEIREKTSGRPLPGMSIKIVDPQTGAPMGEGEPGEIAVKGLTLMRGYHKVDSANVFDAEGFFRSQDGGHLEDGYLYWSGRLSNLIKTGGANVSPLEIESVLDERDDVRVGMAVGVPHPTLGEVVIACVVPASGHVLEEGEVRAYLRERLSAYKVPKRVLFFEASDLALTGNQKIQVGPLREAAETRLQAERAEIDGAVYSA